MTPEEIAAKLTVQRAQRLAAIEAAEKITIMLARRSGRVPGFSWPEAPKPSWRRAAPRSQHRVPPLPFHSFKHLGAGFCRVCGQPVYGKEGSHLKKFGPSKRTWHDVCVTTYTLMTKTADHYDIVAHRQGQLCAVTGEPLRYAEVDHRYPLFRVAREAANESWYVVMQFWMLGNLQVINRAPHLEKCAAEAKERAGYRAKITAQGAML